MPLLKVLAKLMASSLVIYILFSAAFFVGKLALTDNSPDPVLDTYVVKQDICHDEIATPIDNVSLLKRGLKPKLFILGASNARDGLRPQQIAEVLPAYEVHNLAISAGNVTQARQIIEFIIREKRGAIDGSTFVFGAVAGSMFSNEGRGWKAAGTPFSNLVKQHDRVQSERSLVRKVPAIDSFFELISEPMACSARVGQKLYASKDKQLEKVAMKLNLLPRPSQTDERSELANRYALVVKGTSGQPYEEQLLELEKLASLISSLNGRLIVAELPSAPWYAEGLPFEMQLMEELEQATTKIGIPLIAVDGNFTDEMFTDHAHPTQDTTRLWATIFAEEFAAIDQ